jgi:hypothetical protein
VCRNAGFLRRSTAVRGTGWFFEHIPVTTLAPANFEPVRPYYGLENAVDSIFFENSMGASTSPLKVCSLLGKA